METAPGTVLSYLGTDFKLSPTIPGDCAKRDAQQNVLDKQVWPDAKETAPDLALACKLLFVGLLRAERGRAADGKPQSTLAQSD